MAAVVHTGPELKTKPNCQIGQKFLLTVGGGRRLVGCEQISFSSFTHLVVFIVECLEIEILNNGVVMAAFHDFFQLNLIQHLFNLIIQLLTSCISN